jgi:hypothetical protein
MSDRVCVCVWMCGGHPRVAFYSLGTNLALSNYGAGYIVRRT